MDSVVDYAKQETLLLMYQSVDRMNHHVVNGNTAGVIAEQHLQVNYRSNFEELSHEPEAPPQR